jgi:diguanylate cyclase (GGDEF)-like protein
MRKNLEGSYFQTLKVWAIREIRFVSFPNHQDAESSLPAKASFSTPPSTFENSQREKMDIIDQQLIKSIKWLINIRWIGILSLLGIIFLAKNVGALEFQSQPILILSAIAWIYNIIFALDIRKREKREEDRLERVPLLISIANVQIDFDLIILMGFIYFSGGVESPLTLFLFFHMITTGLLLPLKAGIFQATLTLLLYATLIAVEYVGFIPHVCILGDELCYAQNISYISAKIILLGGALYLAFALSGFLGRKLKNQERRLYYMYRKMKTMAMKDELTQVFNYRYFRQQLRTELDRAKRYGHTVSLLMVDVDNLKKFNDNYGHLVGSESLITVAKILRNGTRLADTVAKYGGDEFVIVAPETNEEQARLMSERLRKGVANEYFPSLTDKTQTPKHELTISVGVATYPENAIDDETLIEAADRAVYEAKDLGKNRVCVYTGEKIESVNHQNSE